MTKRTEDILFSLIALALFYGTGAIMFSAQAYEIETYEPPTRDWLTPYPPDKDDE